MSDLSQSDEAIYITDEEATEAPPNTKKIKRSLKKVSFIEKHFIRLQSKKIKCKSCGDILAGSPHSSAKYHIEKIHSKPIAMAKLVDFGFLPVETASKGLNDFLVH